MGVCCIVFDIDGMLFEFFMNFLNIEKIKFYFFQYFIISSRFVLFPTLKICYLVEKQFFLISRFMLFPTVGIYIHYILYSLVLILYLKCGGGLGGGG